MYGESVSWEGVERVEQGLSPRVRGILDLDDYPGHGERSIPACTGNPLKGFADGGSQRVYPRVYGESGEAPGGIGMMRGLSPRVRGIPLPPLLTLLCDGSIPACTGNPSTERFVFDPHVVYPRVYGESRPASILRYSIRGLSPRVRGIRTGNLHRLSLRRSIPACTGNPRQDGVGKREPAVYPRVYGESTREREGKVRILGLSPRVRGIRTRTVQI